MKKKFLLALFVALLSIMAFTNISASAKTYGDLTYEIYNGKVTITDCNTSATGEMIIPETIDGYPVTSIGGSAFRDCTGLISVSIGNGVTSIGEYAFYRCTGLTSVTIPDSVTSIGESAFYGCTGLSSVTIPDSVTSIENLAFHNCSNLIRVNITDIESWCNISFSSSGNPLSFAKKLYLNGELVTDLVIPDNITSIGKYAFSNCTSLTSVTIPDSVTSIENYAFSECTSLTRVDITDLEAWCNISFPDFFSNPIFYANNLYLNGELVSNLVFPDNVTSIGGYAFSNCTSLTSVTIPDSVTSIGNYAFYNCYDLVSATIGSGIELIPENAFYSCDNLKYVAIPTSVKYIRNGAFNECSKITTVFYEGDQSQWESILKYNRNENLTNAKIVYNATKKTYKFETNGDATLPDITDYAIFTAPVVQNDSAKIDGWYDNEALSGDPVTFPYYGDATTLYASWADRGGTSFEDAFIAKPNRDYNVTTEKSGELVYFEFTPTKSKTYNIYSTGSKDTYGYLYNSNKSQITSNNNSGDENNFRISYNLTAGETYYIGAKVYNGTGTFSVFIEEPVEYRINSITLKDFSGKVLTSIPQDTFLATVSFTNVSSNEANVIVLASYSEKGAFRGLMYVTTKDVPTGSTIEIALPVDNTKGDVAVLKALCWDSLGSFVPLGNAVTYPAQ